MKTFTYLVKLLMNHCGFEVRRLGTAIPGRSIKDVLAHVSRLGFDPKVVIDVGVANGTFELYEAFPDSFHLLIEPLEEFKKAMETILNKYNGTYVIGAAYSKKGQIELNVHIDHLAGSSLCKETMGTNADGVTRIVQALKIDDILKEKNLKGPYLIKVDVQGAEIDVLEGAQETLKEAELILLEVSMFPFMVGGPEFYDVVAYMKAHGFVAHDIFGGSTRPLDNALGQIDMAFVKERGLFRRNFSYATPEQWKNMMGARQRHKSG